jgi:hypothetical protein
MPTIVEKAARLLSQLRAAKRHVSFWFLYRLHPEHRYHVVRTGLRPGYWETEDRMLHAMFSLLLEHVEAEGLENIEATANDESDDATVGWRRASLEKIELTRWWKEVRPKRHQALRTMREELHCKPYKPVHDPDDPSLLLNKKPLRNRITEYRKNLDQEDIAMMHRLVDVSPYLWI